MSQPPAPIPETDIPPEPAVSSEGARALSGPLSGRQIARAAGLVMLAFVASGALGLVRNAAISATFGAGTKLDAFLAAQRVPEMLFVLVAGGALGSAFIPVFTRFLADDDSVGAWRLASGVITLLLAVSTGLALLAFVLADPIVEWLLVPGKPEATQALTVDLMRIMLLTVMIFGVSGLLMGILNAHQHFLAPALAPSMYNVGLIFGALVLAGDGDPFGLAWGAVIGAGLHLGVQLPTLRRLDFRFRPRLSLRTPGVTEVLLLMGPRVLGLGIVQVNFWVNTALASGMADGSIAALSFAFTLMFTVLGVLGQSIGTVVFPTLSTLSAQQDDDDFRRTLSGALSSVLFLSIPAGIGLAVVAHPLVRLLFERNAWSPTASAGTAWALALFSVGLAGHAVLEILVRAFYARADTWTPVKVGMAAMVFNIALSLVLIRVFGYPDSDNFARGPFGGLALAMSIATAIESAALWIILRRRVGSLNERRVLGNAARTLLAAGIMALAAGGIVRAVDDVHPLFETLGAMIVGGAVFWIVAMLLNVEEADLIPRLIERLIGRRLRRGRTEA